MAPTRNRSWFRNYWHQMKEWAHKKLNPFKDLHLILLGSGINVAQDIKNKNRKRPIISYLRLYFVIPMRFERMTHALEGRCSIQLSYGTIP